MSDQPTREEYEALARRVQQLEDNFDAHRTVIIAGLQRVERKVDDLATVADDNHGTVMGVLAEHTTVLRAISRHIGLPDD